MLSPLPGTAIGGIASLTSPQSCQPSLIWPSGRPVHRPFRGLPGVHSRYGLHARAVTVYRDPLSEGFSHFVTSIAAPVASGWSVCRVGLAPTGKRRLLTAHANCRRSAVDGRGLPSVCQWHDPVARLCDNPKSPPHAVDGQLIRPSRSL